MAKATGSGKSKSPLKLESPPDYASSGVAVLFLASEANALMMKLRATKLDLPPEDEQAVMLITADLMNATATLIRISQRNRAPSAKHLAESVVASMVTSLMVMPNAKDEMRPRSAERGAA